MLKKELDLVKIITRARKSKILINQEVQDPNERIKMYNSKKIVIELESSEEDNYEFIKKPRAPDIGFFDSSIPY